MATSRGNGAMPQLVQGRMRSASAWRITAAICSGDSISSDAASIAPSRISLFRKSPSSDMGTREIGALQRDPRYPAGIQLREHLLILAPFGASRRRTLAAASDVAPERAGIRPWRRGAWLMRRGGYC
jgi:hypothetical protein